MQRNEKQPDLSAVFERLLPREQVPLDLRGVQDFLSEKTVLVTGGAGSIGSELCRQCLEHCKKLVIFDFSENGLFELDRELALNYSGRYILCLGSVQDEARLDSVFRTHRPEVVFHAAAHKHIPMMEANPAEAVKNNVFGTDRLINACVKHGAKQFVLISTDKAVRPTSVMGATKRLCEMIVQRRNGEGGCKMSAVRFGNVLGSNGSFLPVFWDQIQKGGPVTVTHRDVERYLMTVREAVSLVLWSAMAAQGSEIFVLNMDQPIKIYDLAEKMIRLAGYVPHEEIEVRITGLRPGEKLYEELVLEEEQVHKTEHNRVFVVTQPGEYPVSRQILKALAGLLQQEDNEEEIRMQLFAAISSC